MNVNRIGNSVRVVCVSLSSLLCVTAFTGCSSTPAPQEGAAYAKSLNRYYQGRPMCVWSDQVSFPVQNPAAQEVKDRGYDALISAGLLAQKAQAGATAYELTVAGRAAFDRDIVNKSAGNFCYGRRKVTSITSARHDSPATELVEYQYTVSDAPAWARNSALQAAFPQIATDLSGPHAAQATLLNTTDGWQVAERPLRATDGQRASTLAKMKAVFAPGS
jgi:hypothetical protein